MPRWRPSTRRESGCGGRRLAHGPRCAASAAIRRRPRVALFATVVAVMVLPLVPDLFYVIPWPYRKAAGFVVFVAVLVRVPGPPPAGARRRRPASRGRRPLATPAPLVLPLACLALAVPLLQHPENLGFGDWDLYLQKHEAARRTIALWGQFPWWDPWCRGGFPLAANPQCGVISVAMPLVLAFGTSVGMRLATLVCLLLACRGGASPGLAVARRPVRGGRRGADLRPQRRRPGAGRWPAITCR